MNYRYVAYCCFWMWVAMFIVSCSSGGGIGDSGAKSGIVIDPINFNISKHSVFTTPDVYTYITDEELGGRPFIVDSNVSVTAQYGDVTYSDGRFTYTPYDNIPSGTDSFSFQVLNTNGTSAEGLVTLNIRGWNARNDISTTSTQPWLFWTQEIGDSYVTMYRDGNDKLIMKLNKQTGVWMDPINLGEATVTVDQGSGLIKVLDTEIVGVDTNVNYSEYNPENHTISAPQLVDTIANISLKPGQIVFDTQGNMILQLRYGTAHMVKYYQNSTQTWHDAYDVGADSEDTESWLVDGQPIVFTRESTGSAPQILTYDVTTQLWSRSNLSSETVLPSNEWSFFSGQNNQGDLAVFWLQKITDAGQDYWNVKTNIYSRSQGRLLGEQTKNRFPATMGVNISNVSVLNGDDFLFMWRSVDIDAASPTYKSGDVYAQVFNSLTRDFVTADPVLVVPGFIDVSIGIPPIALVSAAGNVAFQYSTVDVNNNYLHYYKVLPYRGTWSSEQSVNINPIAASFVEYAFDSNNNYFTTFEDGVVQVQSYNFSTSTKSLTVPVGIPSQVFRPELVSSNSGRLFLPRLQESGGEYSLCVDEIDTALVLTSSAVSDMGCMLLDPGTANYARFDAFFFEGDDQILRLFANTLEGVFTAEQDGGSWINRHTIYQHTISGAVGESTQAYQMHIYQYAPTQYNFLTRHRTYSNGYRVRLFGASYN